jgi:hypothetical protein
VPETTWQALEKQVSISDFVRLRMSPCITQHSVASFGNEKAGQRFQRFPASNSHIRELTSYDCRPNIAQREFTRKGQIRPKSSSVAPLERASVSRGVFLRLIALNPTKWRDDTMKTTPEHEDSLNESQAESQDDTSELFRQIAEAGDFTQAVASVISSELHPLAKLVCIAYACLAGEGDTVANASLPTLCALTGLGRTSVQQWRRDLEKSGAIKTAEQATGTKGPTIKLSQAVFAKGKRKGNAKPRQDRDEIDFEAYEQFIKSGAMSPALAMVWAHRGLRDCHKSILTAYVLNSNDRGTIAGMTISQVSKISGMCEASVKRARSELECLGFIKIPQKSLGRTPSAIELLWPFSNFHYSKHHQTKER